MARYYVPGFGRTIPVAGRILYADSDGYFSSTDDSTEAALSQVGQRVWTDNFSPVSGAGVQRGRKSLIPAIGGADLLLSDVTVLGGGTVTLTTGPNGQPALRLQVAAGGNIQIALPRQVGYHWHGDAAVLLDAAYSRTGLGYVTLYASQNDGSYTNGVQQMINLGLAAPLNSALEQGGAGTYWYRKGRHTNIGSPAWPMRIGQIKLRFDARADQALDCYLYGVGLGSKPAKGRICVIWDDGYDSMFGSGYDSFASRGIAQTVAVIGSAQDQATVSAYSYTRQLRAFVDAGNALVAHGPWPALGAGNLFSAYAGASDPAAVANAVADMRQNRQWLADRGLLVPYADQCYVWPQGQFQRSVNDLGLLDAAYAAGFTVCRSVVEIQTSAHYPAGMNFDALSKYNRMALPIIGHQFAGTTAGESTNIGNITAAVSALAASGGDACVMLHRVAADSTADGSMSAISIRKSDLETIAAAIKTQVDAGTLEAVTMPQLVISSSWWAQ